MGIQDLIPYVKKINPNIYKKTTSDKFRGKRIGVDAFLWLHQNISIANKNVLKKTDVINEDADREEIFRILLNMFFDLYLKLSVIHIQLVMCFDGKHRTEKSGTIERRKKTKDRTKERISELESKLESKDPLDINAADADELRKIKAQLNFISFAEMDRFKDIIVGCGIPYYNCIGEGEKTCAMLHRDGITAATLGKDSDMLVYGNRYILSEIRSEGYNIEGVPIYSIVELDLIEVLKTLDLNHTQFIDFCILLGTDYNLRIKGVGPVNAHRLIKEHKSLDKINQDKTCLNIDVCYSEFKRQEYKDTIESGDYRCGKGDDSVIDKLKVLKLEKYYEMIQRAHTDIKVTDSNVEENNSFENKVQTKIKIVIK